MFPLAQTRHPLVRTHFVLRIHVIAALFLFSPPALRAQAPDLRADLQAAYNRQAELFRQKDASGLRNWTTTDYVGYRPDGKKMTRDQEMAVARRQFAALREIRVVEYTLGDPELRVNEVYVTANRKLVALADGPRKASIRINSTTQFRDVWVQEGGKWRLRRHTVLSVMGTVGGKRVNWRTKRR